MLSKKWKRMVSKKWTTG